MYWAVRELRRIEIAGGLLPHRAVHWLKEKRSLFPHLFEMNRVDADFIGTPAAHWVPPDPDSRYDFIRGRDRLKALEIALSSQPDRLRGGAVDWMDQSENLKELIGDFESTSDGGAHYPRAWEQFGWLHSPQIFQTNNEGDASSQANRVASLLIGLPDQTVLQSINGITQWLSAWQQQLAGNPQRIDLWMKVWLLAIKATELENTGDKEIELNANPDLDESRYIQRLNSPVGKLVGMFLNACPPFKHPERPFDSDASLRVMRDAIAHAPHEAKLVACQQMIEWLPYFLGADREWTVEHLIGPLLQDDKANLDLWRAVGRRTQSRQVLEIIGDKMIDRAIDRRLDRKVRQSLVFSIIVECLHSFRRQRGSAVSPVKVTQMLRLVEDEIRAYAAAAVGRFVGDVSKTKEDSAIATPSAEELFHNSVSPFLRQVWPQERSLVTPGVSRSFARVPAGVPGAFSEVVKTIERFLVPFDAWSMMDYGLYGEKDGAKLISRVIAPSDAPALLSLLDLTIDDSERAVVPIDLGEALDQIRELSPGLTDTRSFRRLAALSRR